MNDDILNGNDDDRNNDTRYENIENIIALKDTNSMILSMSQSGYRQGRQEEGDRQSQLGFNKGLYYFLNKLKVYDYIIIRIIKWIYTW